MKIFLAVLAGLFGLGTIVEGDVRQKRILAQCFVVSLLVLALIFVF